MNNINLFDVGTWDQISRRIMSAPLQRYLTNISILAREPY